MSIKFGEKKCHATETLSTLLKSKLFELYINLDYEEIVCHYKYLAVQTQLCNFYFFTFVSIKEFEMSRHW